MTLYEADLDAIAVPVKSVEERAAERKRKSGDVPRTPKPAKEPKVAKAPKEPKEKKPRAKKVKVEPAPVETVEKATIEVPESIDLEIEKALAEPQENAEPNKVKKPRAPRQKKDPTVPPQWFAKYVEGVRQEQATLKPEKVGKKKIKAEAKEAASKSWNNGLTRNRVQNEVDSHLSRMYCNFVINLSYDIQQVICMFIIKMNLTVQAIPTPKGFQHPAAKYDALPRHEFR